MIIRALKPSDIEAVKKIFDANPSNADIEFPDFITNYVCAYLVEDDDGTIITAGGVRLIAEACLITDMNKSTRKRVEALREVVSAAGYICREFRFDWLHAITDDPNWANQMKKNGFVSRGENLEIQIGGVK